MGPHPVARVCFPCKIHIPGGAPPVYSNPEKDDPARSGDRHLDGNRRKTLRLSLEAKIEDAKKDANSKHN